MNQYTPVVPHGIFAVLVDYSNNDWKEIRCVGLLLHLSNGEQTSLEVLPPSGIPPSNECRTEITVSADVNHSVMMKIKQLTGDRSVTTIWKQIRRGEPVRWTFSSSADRDPGPQKLVMYPDLERLLNYLLKIK